MLSVTWMEFVLSGTGRDNSGLPVTNTVNKTKIEAEFPPEIHLVRCPVRGWWLSAIWKGRFFCGDVWLFYNFIYIYGGFLKWWYPQIIHFNKVFHLKHQFWGLGYPYFWKHPYIISMLTDDVGDFWVRIFLSIRIFRSNVQVSWTNLVGAILGYRNLLPILELKLPCCCCCCCCCFSWFITLKLKCFFQTKPTYF